MFSAGEVGKLDLYCSAFFRSTLCGVEFGVFGGFAEKACLQSFPAVGAVGHLRVGPLLLIAFQGNQTKFFVHGACHSLHGVEEAAFFRA